MGGRGGASHRVTAAGGLGQDPFFSNFKEILNKQDAYNYHLQHNWSWNKWFNVLTDEERAGIHDYTDNWYSDINTALRFNQQPSPAVQAMIDGAKSGLDKWTVLEDVVTFRGARYGITANLLQGTEAQLSDYAFLQSRIGKTFTDMGFMSSGVHPNDAWNSDVFYKIYVNKGVSGAYVDEISAYSGEHEFLFNSGTRFKVHQVTTDSYGKINAMVLEAFPAKKKK